MSADYEELLSIIGEKDILSTSVDVEAVSMVIDEPYSLKSQLDGHLREPGETYR